MQTILKIKTSEIYVYYPYQMYMKNQPVHKVHVVHVIFGSVNNYIGGFMKAQYGILRFAKYKGPEIGNIEAHNERTKDKYASNPDVDTERSRNNIHLISPQQKYRAVAEKQIADAGCRTRSDSVRVVEALVTASPEFFKNKKQAEIKEYFTYALDFIKERQAEKTIISAVVHMDEKTPHMHLCFVPLTEDGRLSAKDTVGNRKELTWWQDEFWKHMVKKYPELERGESASETGREHIPPRIYKDLYEKLDDAQNRFDELSRELAMVEKSSMTQKSIFEMLEGFSKYYDMMTPEDRKMLLQAMVSYIELYGEKRDDKHLIKTIHFNIPVTYDGESGAVFVRTKEQQVETCVLLSRGTYR